VKKSAKNYKTVSNKKKWMSSRPENIDNALQ
jgi:hypothetical protein